MTNVGVLAADTESEKDIVGPNVEVCVGFYDGVNVGGRVRGHAFTD